MTEICGRKALVPCDDPFDGGLVECGLPEGHEGPHLARLLVSRYGDTVSDPPGLPAEVRWEDPA